MARRFGRPEYVVDDALKLIANQPSYGAPMLRLEKLNPRNVEHARERLTRVIDEYARRVREIHSVHARIKAADDARAAERLAFDPSPEADKERRYIQSQERLLNQNIATIIKARKAGKDGILVEADTDGGDPFDLAAISPSLAQRAGMGPVPAEASLTDPSLALRAGMGSDPPADQGPINTSPKRQRGSAMMPAEHQAIHTSPKRQRGSAPRQPSASRSASERATKYQKTSRKKCRKSCPEKSFAPNQNFCRTKLARTRSGRSPAVCAAIRSRHGPFGGAQGRPRAVKPRWEPTSAALRYGPCRAGNRRALHRWRNNCDSLGRGSRGDRHGSATGPGPKTNDQ